MDITIDVTRAEPVSAEMALAYKGEKGDKSAHVSTVAPTSADGNDGDIWIIVPASE